MAEALADARSLSPFLAGMISYHMGWVDKDFLPVDPGTIDQGKRIRPRLATLACRAVSGNDQRGWHLAAAIELLHNFTLVHDDIQDQSVMRRHRETVWSIWGSAQAINIGDAIYAASRRILLRMQSTGVSADRILAIADQFDAAALEIVAGQVTDLEFEGGRAATVDDYLSMIGKKTAAIVRFAAWSGAYAGGAPDDLADAFGHFGEALGLGFQIRDDILGIWGAASDTGKPAADDLRRRKQSLPVIELRAIASDADRDRLGHIYGNPDVPDSSVQEVLHLLDKYAVRHVTEAKVHHFHDVALATLEALADSCDPRALDELRSFVKALSFRTY
ncbi:MAG: polyprenyl synthetase family protein [Thermomicrobiales bacterium]